MNPWPELDAARGLGQLERCVRIRRADPLLTTDSSRDAAEREERAWHARNRRTFHTHLSELNELLKCAITVAHAADEELGEPLSPMSFLVRDITQSSVDCDIIASAYEEEPEPDAQP